MAVKSYAASPALLRALSSRTSLLPVFPPPFGEDAPSFALPFEIDSSVSSPQPQTEGLPSLWNEYSSSQTPFDTSFVDVFLSVTTRSIPIIGRDEQCLFTLFANLVLEEGVYNLTTLVFLRMDGGRITEPLHVNLGKKKCRAMFIGVPFAVTNRLELCVQILDDGGKLIWDERKVVISSAVCNAGILPTSKGVISFETTLGHHSGEEYFELLDPSFLQHPDFQFGVASCLDFPLKYNATYTNRTSINPSYYIVLKGLSRITSNLTARVCTMDGRSVRVHAHPILVPLPGDDGIFDTAVSLLVDPTVDCECDLQVEFLFSAGKMPSFLAQQSRPNRNASLSIISSNVMIKRKDGTSRDAPEVMKSATVAESDRLNGIAPSVGYVPTKLPPPPHPSATTTMVDERKELGRAFLPLSSKYRSSISVPVERSANVSAIEVPDTLECEVFFVSHDPKIGDTALGSFLESNSKESLVELLRSNGELITRNDMKSHLCIACEKICRKIGVVWSAAERYRRNDIDKDKKLEKCFLRLLLSVTFLAETPAVSYESRLLEHICVSLKCVPEDLMNFFASFLLAENSIPLFLRPLSLLVHAKCISDPMSSNVCEKVLTYLDAKDINPDRIPDACVALRRISRSSTKSHAAMQVFLSVVTKVLSKVGTSRLLLESQLSLVGYLFRRLRSPTALKLSLRQALTNTALSLLERAAAVIFHKESQASPSLLHLWRCSVLIVTVKHILSKEHLSAISGSRPRFARLTILPFLLKLCNLYDLPHTRTTHVTVSLVTLPIVEEFADEVAYHLQKDAMILQHDICERISRMSSLFSGTTAGMRSVCALRATFVKWLGRLFHRKQLVKFLLFRIHEIIQENVYLRDVTRPSCIGLPTTVFLKALKVYDNYGLELPRLWGVISAACNHAHQLSLSEEEIVRLSNGIIRMIGTASDAAIESPVLVLALLGLLFTNGRMDSLTLVVQSVLDVLSTAEADIDLASSMMLRVSQRLERFSGVDMTLSRIVRVLSQISEAFPVVARTDDQEPGTLRYLVDLIEISDEYQCPYIASITASRLAELLKARQYGMEEGIVAMLVAMCSQVLHLRIKHGYGSEIPEKLRILGRNVTSVDDLFRKLENLLSNSERLLVDFESLRKELDAFCGDVVLCSVLSPRAYDISLLTAKIAVKYESGEIAAHSLNRCAHFLDLSSTTVSKTAPLALFFAVHYVGQKHADSVRNRWFVFRYETSVLLDNCLSSFLEFFKKEHPGVFVLLPCDPDPRVVPSLAVRISPAFRYDWQTYWTLVPSVAARADTCSRVELKVSRDFPWLCPWLPAVSQMDETRPMFVCVTEWLHAVLQVLASCDEDIMSMGNVISLFTDIRIDARFGYTMAQRLLREEEDARLAREKETKQRIKKAYIRRKKECTQSGKPIPPPPDLSEIREEIQEAVRNLTEKVDMYARDIEITRERVRIGTLHLMSVDE